MSNARSQVAVLGLLPRQRHILSRKPGRLASGGRFLDHQVGSVNVPAACRYAVAWVDFRSHKHTWQVVSQVGRDRTVQYSGGLKGSWKRSGACSWLPDAGQLGGPADDWPAGAERAAPLMSFCLHAIRPARFRQTIRIIMPRPVRIGRGEPSPCIGVCEKGVKRFWLA
jgi:hypothetical protein